MLALLRLFLKQSLFIHLGCFTFSVLWIGACKAAETPSELNFARICPIFAMGTLILPAMNLTWIKSLPISKNALIALNSANFFLNFFITGLSLWTIDKIIDRMFIIKEVVEISEAGAFSGPMSLSGAIIIVSIALFLIALSILIPGRIVFSSSNLNFKGLPRRDLSILAAKITVILALVFLTANGYINQHILLTSTMVFTSGAIIAWTLLSVGMPKNPFKIWLASFVLLALAGSFFVLSTAISNLRSGKAANKVAATKYLGVFSGVKSSEYFQYALTSDLPAERINETIREFGTLSHPFFAEEKIRWLKNHESGISFEEVIKSKSSGRALEASLELFDPQNLNESDLRLFLERLNKVAPNFFINYKANNFWAVVNLSDQFVIDLLQSRKSANVSIGLSYMRFHPKKTFFETLVMALASVPENLIPQTQHTLSLMTAQRVGVMELGKVSEGRSRLKYREQICDYFDLKNVRHISYANSNICLREISLKQGREIAAVDSLPLDLNDLGDKKLNSLINALKTH